MTIRTTLAALGSILGLALGLAAPAGAWTTQPAPGGVVVTHQDDGWTIDMRCARARPGFLAFSLTGPTAQSVQGATSVVLFAVFPDGQRVRQAIPVEASGRAATGIWQVNDRSLELFAQGTGMGVGINGGDNIVLRTDMTGTAAARNTIRSECGF